MYIPSNSVGGLLSALVTPAVTVCRLLVNGPTAWRSDLSFVGLLGILLNIRDLEHLGVRFIYLEHLGVRFIYLEHLGVRFIYLEHLGVQFIYLFLYTQCEYIYFFKLTS